MRSIAVSIDEILKDVSDYLEWERDEGTRTVLVAPDVVAELAEGGSAAPAAAPAKTASKPAMTASMPPARKQTPETRPVPAGNDSLETIAAEIAKCTACPLHEGRANTVPGQGNPKNPDILFIGEAPGADEDAQGLAFMGRAGELLTKMIEAMGYTRDEVFIANINKCRPPGNRAPTPQEMETCLPFLKRQIAVLQPKVIVAMGATAVNGLIDLPTGMGITKVRGTWMSFEGIDLMPTFHPAIMLRNPNMKRPVWEDLKTVLGHLGRPIPAVKKR
jgi:uracil-DNA glycosylase family 4